MVTATKTSKSKETAAANEKPPCAASAGAAGSDVAKTIPLKLMVDSRTKRVIFAEAGKEMVDFLFGLLTLRVSSAVRLLNSSNGGGMPGCISRLYSSAASLGTEYMENPRAFKPAVLFPPPAAGAFTSSCPRLLQLVESQEAEKERKEEAGSNPWRNCVYVCGARYCPYASLHQGEECQRCHREMNDSLILVGDGPGSGRARASHRFTAEVAGDDDGFRGFVRDLDYMVTDDLRVLPSSAFSCMELMQGSGVGSVGDLEERVVAVGMEQGLALLKASLESETVLTDVFLGNGEAPVNAESKGKKEIVGASPKKKQAKMAHN